MVFIIGETIFVQTIEIQQETIGELKSFDLLIEGNAENDIKSLNKINVFGQMKSLVGQSREKT